MTLFHLSAYFIVRAHTVVEAPLKRLSIWRS